MSMPLATADPDTTPQEGDVYDPTGPEPEFLFEVENGLIVRKTVGAEEVRLAARLYRLLGPAVDALGAGEAFPEIGITLTTGHQRKPDISFVSYARWPRARPIPQGDFMPVAPELAVEVISPHETARKSATKVREYLTGGVEVVWLIYPDLGEVHVFTAGQSVAAILTRADTLTGDPLIPGFRLPLADLFPPAAGTAP
ncbi:MAG: Uma2 family endonuclease [Gemmataceae bacterium]